MALVGETGKRPHVKTEKMLEFIKTQEEQHKSLSCPYDGCTKVLTSYPGLKYHIKRNHEPQDEFSCNSCGRPFKSANGLRYHSSKGKCMDSCKKWDSEEEGILRNDSEEEDYYRRVNYEDEGSRKIEPEEDQGDVYSKKDSEEKSCSQHEALKVKRENKPRKKLPPALDLLNDSPCIPGTERLKEFAIIATSPLVQRAPIIPWDDHNGMKTDRQTYTGLSEIKLERGQQCDNLNSTDNNGNYCDDSTVTSTSQGTNEGVWSHQWPKPVWQCFITGTKVCIGFVHWEDVEQLALQDSIAEKAAGLSGQKYQRFVAPNGLRLIDIRKFAKLDNITQSLVHLYFTSDVSSQLDLVAECIIDHPFFVKGKGWCSNDPVLTERHYGIPCNMLEINDVCLPSIRTDNTTSYEEFSPMDRTAVLMLSTMAKNSSPKKRIQGSKKRQLKTDPNKPKRPPNAFMLFAKAHREEYTQKYPGKDNRAISVLLGEKWKKMTNDCRTEYIDQARKIAEQQKKIHPDCWKRKK